MANGGGYLVLGSILVMSLAAIFIALNWLSFIVFIVQKRKGNFSFAPPFLCGVFGAIASFGGLEQHAAWFAIGFVLLDPCMGLALGAIAIQKWLK